MGAQLIKSSQEEYKDSSQQGFRDWKSKGCF